MAIIDSWVQHHCYLDASIFTPHSMSKYPAGPHDWETHKTEIAQQYAQVELRSLMQYMEARYSFSATEKQWKNQLRKWGMKKRNSGSDYRAILRKKREREKARPGVPTEFRLHGELIPQAKIERYEYESRKKGKPIGDDDLEDAPTPPYLECGTPPLSPQMSYSTTSSVAPSTYSYGTYQYGNESVPITPFPSNQVSLASSTTMPTVYSPYHQYPYVAGGSSSSAAPGGHSTSGAYPGSYSYPYYNPYGNYSRG